MEKEEYSQKESFFKIRSYTSCFKKGFELYIRNFKSIFKLLWLPMLFSALILTVIIYFGQTAFQTNNITTISSSTIIIGGIFLILWVLTYSFKFGTLITIFNKYKEEGYIPKASLKALKNDIFHYSCRSFILLFWIILYWIITTAIVLSVIFSLQYGLGIRCTLRVIIFLLFLTTIINLIICAIPMEFIGMKYLMGNEGFLKSFIKSYKIAIRHWGTIFALVLITSIVTMGISIILNMPESILLTVKRMSLASVEFGDASGLPQGFVFFSLLVLFLCSFLQVNVNLAYYFPMLFQYASIETDNQERENLIKLNAKEDYDTMASLKDKKKYEEENFIYRS